MSMIKIKMNTKALNKLTKATEDAIRATAFKMLGEKIDAQEIPFNEGTLQNVLTDVDDSAASKGIVKISSKGPYAIRLYYNPQYDFSHEKNTNAKGEWWEDFISGKNANRPKMIFAHYYKKYSGLGK